jgi:S-adenosylmethionine:tRNA ribosyltransferase-isomerase
VTELLISAQGLFQLELYANSPGTSLFSVGIPRVGRHCGRVNDLFTCEFEFDLPDELIAQHPIEPRDQSRLMVVNRQQECWDHRTFDELPNLLRSGDVLVRNNSRVIPARLVGHRAATGGKWEGLFLREMPNDIWEILATTRGQPVPGEHVVVGQGLHLILESRGASGSWMVRPKRDGNRNETTLALLERHGQTPLPPYIRHGEGLPEDQLAYQTVYAQRPGSVAAPTAGLHFTTELFTRLAASRITWVDLMLHVGLGTFRPIEAKRLEDHVMHAEWAELSAQAVATLESRRSEGGRVVAVGTTSARVLETAAATNILQPFSGETKLFIRPGHVFHGLDALITNFHLPRSSLLVLVSAFAGLELIRAAYAEAIRLHYRFFSYGDAMLIV